MQVAAVNKRIKIITGITEGKFVHFLCDYLRK